MDEPTPDELTPIPTDQCQADAASHASDGKQFTQGPTLWESIVLGGVAIVIVAGVIIALVAQNNSGPNGVASAPPSQTERSDGKSGVPAAEIRPPQAQSAPLSPEKIEEALNKHEHPELSLSPSPYHFAVTFTDETTPTLDGTTDVPDGTSLMITIGAPYAPDARERLARGLPACGDRCWFATTMGKFSSCQPPSGPYRQQETATAEVENGRFSAGPFSHYGKSLPAGAYTALIAISPDCKNHIDGWLHATKFEISEDGHLSVISNNDGAGSPNTPSATSGDFAPANPNVSKFQAEMQPYSEIYEEAAIAMTCNLRSVQWFETILTAHQLVLIRLRHKYRVSGDVLEAAGKEANAVIGRARLPDACVQLSNSPTMAKLDAYEYRATGGYH